MKKHAIKKQAACRSGSSRAGQPAGSTGDGKTRWSRRDLGAILLGLIAARAGLRPAAAQTGPVVFAIIGDYGEAGQPELDVANMVKSWNPEFIVTNGDNNYGDGSNAEGSAATIDKNIGQYYHEFIRPYTGSYGAGSPDVNRFFPILADKDYNPSAGYAPYLAYFTLPGNERYYEFVWGPVHFFMVNSETHEPDGFRHPSVQSAWLQARLAASTAPWKLVHLHNPPYSSNTSFTNLQWPFAQWGADVVSSGQAHVYERILRDGIVYFINGLGGRSTGSFETPVQGSVVRFGADYGAQRVTATADSITFEFFTRAGALIDSYTLNQNPLAAPTSLTASVVSSTQVDLAWQDNATVEDGYRVERSTDGVNFTEIGTAPANATSYSDTTAAPETTYHYRVRASQGTSFSGYSNVVNATTSTQPPAAPSGLSATAVSPSQVNLAWTDNANNEDGFKIDRSTDGTNFTELASVGANATSYSDNSGSSQTTYHYRVRAFRGTTFSSYSNVANATTLVGPPAAPSGLSATAASTSQINLAWTDNANNEDSFEIERSTDGVNFAPLAAVGANVRTYSDTGLSSGVTYHYRVRAANAAGSSAYSNTATSTTQAPLGAPSNLTATATSDTKIRLNWQDNSSGETGFEIERSSDGVNFTLVKKVAAGVVTWTNSNLTGATTYYFRVRAYNATSKSAYSNTASATTNQPKPVAPSGTTATAVSSTRIDIAWTDNSGNETGFKVYRSLDGVTFSTAKSLGANVTSWSDLNRTPGTTYYYQVRAFNASGNSAASNTASATTPS